jgi:hypothetical protein
MTMTQGLPSIRCGPGSRTDVVAGVAAQVREVAQHPLLQCLERSERRNRE